MTTISLAPIAPAFSGTPASPSGLPVPRYVEKDQGPFTILSVKGVTTALLMPFVSWTGAAGGNFDTGIAIANTTQDATMAVMGTTGADVKAINGAITFYFFPQGTGTHPAAYTTSATSPGSGLDANGLVPSGSTYVVLLSQLLSATTGVTPAAPYQGYVIAVAGFTNAHGQYVLSNFTTFGQASLMLVLTNRAAPESLGN